MTDQSDADIAGIFSRRTNQRQDARVYSHLHAANLAGVCDMRPSARAPDVRPLRQDGVRRG
eukprot:1194961-Prorocentrum_minimum.AAC.4